MEVGECLPDGVDVVGKREADPDRVPCTELHRYEAYARVRVDLDGEWPGESAAVEAADEGMPGRARVGRGDRPKRSPRRGEDPAHPTHRAELDRQRRPRRRVPVATRSAATGPAGGGRRHPRVTSPPMSSGPMRIGLSLPTMLAGCNRDVVLGWSRRIEADGYDTIGFGERIAYQNLEMLLDVVGRRGGHRTGADRLDHRHPADARRGVGGQADGHARRALGRSGHPRRWSGWPQRGLPGDGEPLRLPFRPARRAGRDRSGASGPGSRPMEGLDPVGPSPVQAAIPILSGAMGPKSIARSRQMGGRHRRLRDGPLDRRLDLGARTDGRGMVRRRARRPAVPDDELLVRAGRRRRGAAEGLCAATTSGCSGPSSPTPSPTAAPRTDPTAIIRALSTMAELGYDEVQLVPTTTDLAELDRLGEVVERFRDD